MNKEIGDLNNAVNQLDLEHFTQQQQNVHSLQVHVEWTLSKMDHVIITFNEFKAIEIIPSMFPGHNGLKLKFIDRKKIHQYVEIKQYS